MRRLGSRVGAPAALVLLTLSCSGGQDDGNANGNSGGTGGGVPNVSGGMTPGSPKGGSTASGGGSSASGGQSIQLPNMTGGVGGTEFGKGDECAAVEQQAKSTLRPVDVIFVIDNSSSMDGEIKQVQQRINEDFAEIIGKSGLDYRVIMISRYGDVEKSVGESDHPICIGQPLGASDCSDPTNTPLQNAERFFHFSADVESRNSWCVLLDGFDKPDEYGDKGRSGWIPLAPNGWSQYLREDSFKTFVEITDDDVNCKVGPYDFNDNNSIGGGENAAAKFDAALLALSPEHFGTAEERNYRWHSIVAMVENDPVTKPWSPTDPIQTSNCSPGSSGPGTGYQALSRMTGGLRYPTCENDNFNAIFNAIAEGIVAGAQLNCEWDIPEPPNGQTFDKELVNVRYTPGDGSAPEDIAFVSNAGDCTDDGGWHYDDDANPTQVVACPATCSKMKRDTSGRIDVLFGCKTIIMVPK